ncbi:MAG: mechanosensitive ion channel [Nitrospiraceae bacterium]|nr:MAG: mechanosensitive ion channel [Nitrospiraceae bacterium]
MENAVAKVQELVSVLGLKIIAALAIFIIGKWASKLSKKIVSKIMTKKNIDPTIISFVINLVHMLILAFAVLAALGQLGVQTTSFVAVIGAAGLAIGLALQGSLANFAAGFLMIIFRPFKVGDVIEAAGVIGSVEAMQVFTTQLKTGDNKVIIIPNAKLTADNIVNYSAKGTRRVDLVCGIGYQDDIDKAKQVVNDLLAADERVLKDPAPTVAVLEMADSSVNFVVRPWVNTADYWNVYFDTTEKIKKRFDEEGISIPFPQRDVHIYEHKGE